MAQTLVLAKHLDNHGHLTGPEYEHLITTFPVDAFEELWERKGWVLVNRSGEPVSTIEEADPEKQADPAAAAVDVAALRRERVQKFQRASKTPKTEKAEG